MSVCCESENEVKELLNRAKKRSKRKAFFEKTQKGSEVTWNLAKENK